MSVTEDFSGYTEFVEVNQNNFEQIKNKSIKIGYSDGVNDGRESAFQQGFDQGYKDGFATAFNLEKFRFFFQNLKNIDKMKNADLAKEKDEFSRVPLRELKYLKIEDNSLNVDSQDYVNKALEKFAQKMPIASNLLD